MSFTILFCRGSFFISKGPYSGKSDVELALVATNEQVNTIVDQS